MYLKVENDNDNDQYINDISEYENEKFYTENVTL